jgi:hypothetical protein
MKLSIRKHRVLIVDCCNIPFSATTQPDGDRVQMKERLTAYPRQLFVSSWSPLGWRRLGGTGSALPEQVTGR